MYNTQIRRNCAFVLVGCGKPLEAKDNGYVFFNVKNYHEMSIICNHCGSDQTIANKKGFSGAKAVAGGLMFGGLGLFAGTIGSNKIKITCLNCGNEFSPNSIKSNSFVEKNMYYPSSTFNIIWAIFCLIFVIFVIVKC